MIECSDLFFEFEDEKGKSVLKGINLNIAKGEFLAVLGHNGSGKSTFAKLLNGIYIPSSGSVKVDGKNTSDEESIFEIRKNVGMVFQNPDNQIVATVVEEDVAFALENLGIQSAEIRERVDSALKSVGLYEERKKAPHMLSGGQKQRVAIAGVIALRPSYIVLDEPTAMLDPVGRAEVMEVLHKLKNEFGLSVILITHNMDEAAEADRIVIINDGEVICDGKPPEVFSQVEMLKSVGLDVPQTTELLYELRKEGAEVSINKLSVAECVAELEKLLEA